MPAKRLTGLENPSQNLANSTPVSTSLCTPLSFPVTFHALLLPTFHILCSTLPPLSSQLSSLLWTSPSLRTPLQFPLHCYSVSASLTTPLSNALSTPLASLQSTLHLISTSLSTSFHRTFPSHLHTVVRDEDTARYEHGEPRARPCLRQWAYLTRSEDKRLQK